MKNFVIFVIIFLLFLPLKTFALIDINSATILELDKITEVGPSTAQKIIDARPFNALDDLLKVKGIGEKTLQKIKDQGLAYVESPNKQTQNPNQIPNLNDQKTITTPTPTVTQAPIIYPSGVFINEILPSPQGADEENEWVELYNTNNFTVDLSNWKLKDSEGTITTYAIPLNTKILANSFLVFKRPDTKISLNNSGDTLNLILPNNKLIDSVSFTKAPLNQSYNKINSNWIWNTNLTKGMPNIVLADLPKLKNSDNNNNVSQENLATLSQALNENKIENKNPWILFFITILVAIILSIVILVIKLKLKNK